MSANIDTKAMYTQKLKSGRGKTYEVGRPNSEKPEDEAKKPSSSAKASSGGGDMHTETFWLPSFDVDVNWECNKQTQKRWITTDGDFRAQTGITRYRFDIGGIYYKYRLTFTNVKTYNYRFIGRDGDFYGVNTWQNGDHYVDYNVDSNQDSDASIVHITGT